MRVFIFSFRREGWERRKAQRQGGGMEGVGRYQLCWMLGHYLLQWMTLSFFQVMHTHTLMYTTHTHALTSSHIHYTPAVAVTGTSWALWCVHLLLENDCWRFSASLWQWLGDKISVGEREERVSQQWQKHFSFGQAKYRVRVMIIHTRIKENFCLKILITVATHLLVTHMWLPLG